MQTQDLNSSTPSSAENSPEPSRDESTASLDIPQLADGQPDSRHIPARAATQAPRYLPEHRNAESGDQTHGPLSEYTQSRTIKEEASTEHHRSQHLSGRSETREHGYTQLTSGDTSDTSQEGPEDQLRRRSAPDAGLKPRYAEQYPTYLTRHHHESQLLQPPYSIVPFSPLPALSSRPPMPPAGTISPLIEVPVERRGQPGTSYRRSSDYHPGFRAPFMTPDLRTQIGPHRSNSSGAIGSGEDLSLDEAAAAREAAREAALPYYGPTDNQYAAVHEDLHHQYHLATYPPHWARRGDPPYQLAPDAIFEAPLNRSPSERETYAEGYETGDYEAAWNDPDLQRSQWRGTHPRNLASTYFSSERVILGTQVETTRISSSSSSDDNTSTSSRTRLRKRKSHASLKSRKKPGPSCHSSRESTVSRRSSSSTSLYRVEDATRRTGARLVRTSELSQADASLGPRHISRRRMAQTSSETRVREALEGGDARGIASELTGSGWGSAPTSHQAALIIDGDLDMVTRHWSMNETVRRRRLVRFHRAQDGGSIRLSFEVVSQDEYTQQGSTTISCIWWTERAGYYVTSVDCIALLEYAIGQPFSIEEKNRIRRNLEAVKPVTISKNKPESQPFFRLIMNFEPPRPRNIEKDVKVFAWPKLEKALKKIISKYSVSYDESLAQF